MSDAEFLIKMKRGDCRDFIKKWEPAIKKSIGNNCKLLASYLPNYEGAVYSVGWEKDLGYGTLSRSLLGSGNINNDNEIVHKLIGEKK